MKECNRVMRSCSARIELISNLEILPSAPLRYSRRSVAEFIGDQEIFCSVIPCHSRRSGTQFIGGCLPARRKRLLQVRKITRTKKSINQTDYYEL